MNKKVLIFCISTIICLSMTVCFAAFSETQNHSGADWTFTSHCDNLFDDIDCYGDLTLNFSLGTYYEIQEGVYDTVYYLVNGDSIIHYESDNDICTYWQPASVSGRRNYCTGHILKDKLFSEYSVDAYSKYSVNGGATGWTYYMHENDWY